MVQKALPILTEHGFTGRANGREADIPTTAMGRHRLYDGLGIDRSGP